MIAVQSGGDREVGWVLVPVSASSGMGAGACLSILWDEAGSHSITTECELALNMCPMGCKTSMWLWTRVLCM